MVETVLPRKFTMPNEIELKLALTPESLRKLQALPWIHALAKKSVTRQTLISVYYDTKKFTLRENGVSLRVRRIGAKRLQTIKAAGTGAPFARQEWEQEISSYKPDFAYAKDTPLQPLLSKALRRSLRPVFETRVHRTAIPVRIGRSEVELAIDRGTIKTGGRSCRISEVELELKKGDPAMLCKIAERISRVLPVQYAVKTKPERGYALAEGIDAEAVPAEDITLKEDADAANAFQVIGLSCLRHVARNKDAVRKGDAEGVHQMRVALRRLRAAISIFKDILQDKQTSRLKKDLRWLTEQLEPARDYDVLIKGTVLPLQKSQSERTEIETLLYLLRKKRDAGFAQAKNVVTGERYRRVVLALAIWLADGDWYSSPNALQRRRRKRLVVALAREFLAKRSRKIIKKLRKLDRLDVRQRHNLRIGIKKLRYAMEFFSSQYSDAKKGRKAFAKLLGKLQSALGKLNDIQVHEDLTAKIVARKGTSREERRKTALAVELLEVREKRKVKPLLAAATKTGTRLAKLKPFWK
jgi:triphosphatase